MKKAWAGLIACLMLLAVYGCSKNNEIYDEMIEQGLLQAEQEEYERANTFFERALEEKPKDEKAAALVEQTKKMIEAKKAYGEGDFKAAKGYATESANVGNGSEMLNDKAKSLIEQMKELEKQKEEISASYDKAEQYFTKGELDDSFSILGEILKKDLSNPFFAELKADIDNLMEEVKEAQEKAREEAEARAKAEEAARKLAEEKAAAERAEKERKVKEERAKEEAASNDVGAAAGYWILEDRTEACHLTSAYFACAVVQSDMMFKEPIAGIRHLSGTEMELTFGNGHKTTISLADQNVLVGEHGNMYRVTKEEANSIYGGYYELP